MTTLQYGATIQKPIVRDKVNPLRDLLQSMGDTIQTTTVIPFAQLTSAHFLCWFILDRDGVGPFLFLELNVDGPIKPFLDDLVAKAGPGIDQIYGNCVGYPTGGTRGAPAEVVRYLIGDDVGYDCYYIGWRGLTVSRILQERDLRKRLEAFLDQQGDFALATVDPGALRKRLQDEVLGDPTFAWAKTFPPRPFLVRNRDAVLAALKVVAIFIGLGLLALAILAWQRFGLLPVIGVVVLLAAIVIGLVALLRWKEDHDSVSDAEPDHGHVMTVTTRENEIVQNHFASIADVKPGLFRQVILKGVLRLVHIIAAVSSNQGNLSGITSIHFARWVVVNQGRQLLFLSNYDGSWENYLDDFIDRASPGLTAIWSNTVGFPRTRLLTQGGAADELLFKTLVRKSQMLSLAWYSAYPDLTTQCIQTNAAIREGLFVSMDDAAVRDWLKNF